MRRITDVHMVGGTKHEHIAAVKWVDDAGPRGESTRAEMVSWIDGGGKAYVSHGTQKIAVGVVNAVPKYIRTHADGVWTDNLLALPRY